MAIQAGYYSFLGMAMFGACRHPVSKIFHIFMIVSIRTAGMCNRHHWRTRITLLLSGLVVANSCAGLSAFRVPQKKSSVVYNAMDPDHFQLIKPRECNCHRGSGTVIMTGRISPLKDKDFTTYFEAARQSKCARVTEDVGSLSLLVQVMIMIVKF